MKNAKIIAHIPQELLYPSGLLVDPFLLLARTKQGYTWFAIEQNMINRYDNKHYNYIEDAIEVLKQEYGAENVVIEPFNHIEVT